MADFLSANIQDKQLNKIVNSWFLNICYRNSKNDTCTEIYINAIACLIYWFYLPDNLYTVNLCQEIMEYFTIL